MIALRTTLACALVCLAACGPSGRVGITFEPYEFEANDGTVVAAERGTFRVPENRARPDSREVEIGFVRFPSTSETPGTPIVYLAGGPGSTGTGTARGPRFPLFMAMREFGDVIAFDQRGTGLSSSIPQCRAGAPPPLDLPLDLELWLPQLRAAVDECAVFWADEGVDLAGYNTAESARDIEALRQALGVETVSLWGISYGSHLAMAALKEMPGRIDRVVLAAIEGLDQTVKLPARTDAYFGRLQAAIDLDPAAAAAYPDLVGLMRRVHAKLEEEPATVTINAGSGETVTMVIGATDLRLLAMGAIADPARATLVPPAWTMADAGDFSQVGPPIYQNYRGAAFPIRGMPLAMDIMSGVPEARLARVREQAETSILGDLLNFPMPHLIGAMGLGVLGEDFWSPVETDVPTLVLTGTLDGRTYPEGAADALAGFTNLQEVIVENGGHNVYMQAPVIGEIVLGFMRGVPAPERVTLDPPRFPLPPSGDPPEAQGAAPFSVATVAFQDPIPFRPYEERAYRLVNSVAFSPDDQLVYLNLFYREVLDHRGTPDPDVAEVALFSARRTPDGWSEPELLPFSGEYIDYEATLTADGSLMVFNTQRPWPDGRVPEENDLWMVERDGDGWGEPARIEAVTTFDDEESYATLTADRTLVFMCESRRPDGESAYDLCESRYRDGAFQAPTRHPVSTDRYGEGDPWIAPDGSYLIYTRWDDEVGWAESVDLYVAFQDDGVWSEPVALDNINTAGADFGPAVSPDGRWLYSKSGSDFSRRPIVEVLAPYRS